MRVSFLGTGTSHGIPSVGCDCEVCASPDPRDRRARCGITVQWRGKTVLVDTPPELRQAVIRSRVRRIDLILYTHTHADHLFGLDDVRRYNEAQGGELPVFGRPHALDDVRRAYVYVFTEGQTGGGKPKLALQPLTGDRLEWEGLEIEAVPVYHGALEVLAFRFGSFAYVTDTNRIPEESMARLRGLDTLVLGALRWEAHPTHFTIDESLQVARELGARRTFFTHMTHDVPHAATERGLPDGIRLAYDGLVLDIPD